MKSVGRRHFSPSSTVISNTAATYNQPARQPSTSTIKHMQSATDDGSFCCWQTSLAHDGNQQSLEVGRMPHYDILNCMKLTKITSHSALLTCRLFRAFLSSPLMLFFIQPLSGNSCYKLSSIVTFTFIQIFFKIVPSLLNGVKVAMFPWYVKIALFSVSGLKHEKLIKKQIYMKTETCKLYSRVFWIFLPNFIKIDPYNFELYHFKAGAFFWDTV